jgi:glycerate kinase
MKFLFAPDSFKGSLDALAMARMMDRVCRLHFPEAQTVLLPMADGGEGTVDALLAACPGRVEFARVTGPDGNP